MPATREDVLAAVAAAFAADGVPAVLAQLDCYGVQPHERERERVQLAIVALAAGDATTLRDLVQLAKRDYRDILLWQASGPLTPAQGARLRADVAAAITRLQRR